MVEKLHLRLDYTVRSGVYTTFKGKVSVERLTISRVSRLDGEKLETALYYEWQGSLAKLPRTAPNHLSWASRRVRPMSSSCCWSDN